MQIARERLEAAVARLRDRSQRRAPENERLDDFLNANATQPSPDRVVIKDGESILVIPAHEIDWCEANDNYVRIHAGPKRHLIRMTMRHLEEQLPRAMFARIHRSAIVNVERVRECTPLGGGEYRVTLASGVRLVVSRSYRAAVLNRLQRP